jgi:hypothetical protein
MRVSLERKFGKTVQFIGVLEFQKSGVAHLHLLVGLYIPQDWLSTAWESIGGGKIVDIRSVDIHRVTMYLTAPIWLAARSSILWACCHLAPEFSLRHAEFSSLRNGNPLAGGLFAVQSLSSNSPARIPQHIVIKRRECAPLFLFILNLQLIRSR